MIFISDDIALMTLSGVGIEPTSGCYDSGDSLFELSGPDVRLEDCLFLCLVH